MPFIHFHVKGLMTQRINNLIDALLLILIFPFHGFDSAGEYFFRAHGGHKLRLDAEMQKGLIGIKGGAVCREQIYTD